MFGALYFTQVSEHAAVRRTVTMGALVNLSGAAKAAVLQQGRVVVATPGDQA